MKCIDVSHYNGNINWILVKEQGINHVIIKAINKQNNADLAFSANYTGAINCGFEIGVYNYSYATNTTQATIAANALLNQIKGKKINLGVWLDVEDTCQKNLGHLLIDIINTYAYVIKKAGYKFGIYTGLSFYNSYLKPWANELDYPFWIARYPSSVVITPTSHIDATKKPAIGKSIWGWQYSSKCQVKGISGYTDISEIYNIAVAPTVTNTTVYIGHASIDENGKTSGGMTGDQTGKEVCVRTWYNKPWNTVVRAKDPVKAEKIAKAMEQACANENIGYDQSNRMSLYEQAKGLNWDISKVGLCECDCSSLVAVCCNAAGIAVSKSMTTRNELNTLLKTNEFTMGTDPMFTKTSANLKRGDILIGTGHTAIVLGDGISEVKPIPIQTPTNILEEPTAVNAAAAGWYQTTANLKLRYGAGTDKGEILVMPKNSKVLFYGRYSLDSSGKAWMYVVYCNIIGYCSVDYLKKI